MMFVLREFWKPAACSRVRTAMDRGRGTAAEIYSEGYRVDENARRAFDVDVDPDTVEEVQRDIDLGNRLNITSTPTVIITKDVKSNRVAGFVTYEILRRYLDQLLTD